MEAYNLIAFKSLVSSIVRFVKPAALDQALQKIGR